MSFCRVGEGRFTTEAVPVFLPCVGICMVEVSSQFLMAKTKKADVVSCEGVVRKECGDEGEMMGRCIHSFRMSGWCSKEEWIVPVWVCL